MGHLLCLSYNPIAPMIRVIIVDDQKVITQGLKMLLESEPDIQIVGTGSNGIEAIQLATDLRPDVLLIDQNMPVMMGIEAVRKINSQFSDIAILLLSGSDQDDCITEALQAGAKGYLLKTTSSEDLASSIRAVHRGYSQMGPGLLEKLLAKVNSSNGFPANVQPSQSPLKTKLFQILDIPSKFDCDKITNFLQSVTDAQVATECIHQLEKLLQRNPHHVSALYLTGQMTDRFQQQPKQSMNYFRLAFQNSQEQEFPLQANLHICSAAWRVSSDETFRWLDAMFKEWPQDKSYQPLFEAIAQVFGPSTEPYRLLKASWEIQHLNHLCEQTNALKSTLSQLQSSLAVLA
jgi:DNA-binding NarL/FixJ family response regulator